MSGLETGVTAPARLGQVLEVSAARLRTAGIEGPRRDARLLLGEALGLAPAQVLAYPERAVTEAELEAAEALIARRAAREPVSRILGRREFWGLEFRITPDTLDPRPESETLVAAALERIPSRQAPLRILDLGTGSGCLLLALLSELPQARGLGLDISRDALAAARDNAERLGLAARARFAWADWTQDGWAASLGGPWQVIVSNPPYIVEADIPELGPEVARFDPRPALDAGPDGLSSYRRLLPEATGLLAPEGLMLVEIGAGQAEAVCALMAEAGLDEIESRADLTGTPRCLIAHAPGDRAVSQTGDRVKK